MHLLAGKASAFQRAKTRKNLGHIPLNWLVEFTPWVRPTPAHEGKSYIYDNEEETTRATTGERGGPYYLLTNLALCELFSGYVSVPKLL